MWCIVCRASWILAIAPNVYTSCYAECLLNASPRRARHSSESFIEPLKLWLSPGLGMRGIRTDLLRHGEGRLASLLASIERTFETELAVDALHAVR